MKIILKSFCLLPILTVGICQAQIINTTAAAAPANAPAVLPGRGLAQHDFFYAGEAKEERMFIVRKGEVVWSHIINDWFNQWSGTVDRANPPVQAIEMTPEKKIVWALRSWTPPADLGPATTIQILD